MSGSADIMYHHPTPSIGWRSATPSQPSFSEVALGLQERTGCQPFEVTTVHPCGPGPSGTRLHINRRRPPPRPPRFLTQWSLSRLRAPAPSPSLGEGGEPGGKKSIAPAVGAPAPAVPVVVPPLRLIPLPWRRLLPLLFARLVPPTWSPAGDHDGKEPVGTVDQGTIQVELPVIPVLVDGQ
ncbi:hypothetical protein PAPYR_12955 [Paratrimastix pyriformis]|uniref:Uncharacterized protein n=1 Tax=Paratrimastix pyriformis TaxID=342808 RepID=A0ABQ8U667_9EUKA|nr:hypothetical protein PAPYR_12955 [Paratrimastix pyriformis]